MRSTLLAVAATGVMLSLAQACSSSDNGNPTPTVRDSGADGTKTSGSTRSSSSASVSGASNSSSTVTTSTGTHDGGTSSTVAIIDSGVQDVVHIPDVSLDTGHCTPDSSACNSCYTDAQSLANPYNVCSPYTKNCVKFTGTVPSHPTL